MRLWGNRGRSPLVVELPNTVGSPPPRDIGLFYPKLHSQAKALI